jgi:hypothetical protein
MHDFPEAYTADNFRQLLNANDDCPSLSDGELQRLLDLAQQRASARGEPLDDDQVDCLIATEWTGFTADEFGFDNGEANQFAMGVFEGDVSSGKGADLFNDTVVVQNGWLTTGDGRRSQIEEYVDDEYDGADTGELWIPNGAQDYIAIIAISNELLSGNAEL